jgi:hypothetical protein
VSRQIDEWAFEALKAGGVLADGESTTEPESHQSQRRFSILFYFPLKNTQTEPREEREHTQRSSDGGVGAAGGRLQKAAARPCGAARERTGMRRRPHLFGLVTTFCPESPFYLMLLLQRAS